MQPLLRQHFCQLKVTSEMIYYFSLPAVCPMTNQSSSFSTFYPATFSFMTNTSHTDFTDLIRAPLLSCSAQGTVGMLVCSSCSFPPHHSIVLGCVHALPRLSLGSKNSAGARNETHRLQAPLANASFNFTPIKPNC